MQNNSYNTHIMAVVERANDWMTAHQIHQVLKSAGVKIAGKTPGKTVNARMSGLVKKGKVVRQQNSDGHWTYRIASAVKSSNREASKRPVAKRIGKLRLSQDEKVLVQTHRLQKRIERKKQEIARINAELDDIEAEIAALSA